MVTEQRKTLLKLQWSKQQGHLQCHSDSMTKMPSESFVGCCFSLYPITQAVSECEFCVCVYHNGSN